MCLSVLLLWAAGCDDSRARTGVDGGESISWQRQRVAVEADGFTAAVRFELSKGAQAFALRAYPVTAGALACFALRDVVVNGVETWVGADAAVDSGDYCSECAQRVSVGSGYGFAVLPSAADAALSLDAVSARITLRDCLTLTAQSRTAQSPSELWVELASWSPPPPAAALVLSIATVVASRYGLAADPVLLPAALEVVKEIWSVAGIHLVFEPTREINAPEAPVTYSAVDRGALDELARRAGEMFPARATSLPVLILAPCLLRTDTVSGGHSEPWAMTPHLPGGAAVGDIVEPIFVAAERCEGLSPTARFSQAAQLGAVMAHELGHYLGLYHVHEQDGRQDQLSDTDVSEPNLMRATPSPAATLLSPSQVAIARRHITFANAP